MFEVGGIYKFLSTYHAPLLQGLHAQSVRECPAGEGSRLVDEQCFTTEHLEEGYYRVLEILGERKIQGERRYGRPFECYDMDLRLERVAGFDWFHDTPEEFYQKLKGIGCYVWKKEVYERIGEGRFLLQPAKVIEIFAVDPKRGIIIQTESSQENIDALRPVTITLILPSARTHYRLAYQLATPDHQCFRMYRSNDVFASPYDYDEREMFPTESPRSSYWRFRYFAPDILDVLKQNEIEADEEEGLELPHFTMPFVDYRMYEDQYSRVRYDETEYMAYFERCQAVFAEFPSEVQDFLREYTDVSQRYLEGEPWKEYEPRGDRLSFNWV